MKKKTELLAKMMAAEDINVIFSNAKTASFNPVSRTLAMPTFVEDSPECVRFGFVAHEISHAIHTPAVEKVTPILNIVEDIRIEKLIKRKFRGSANYISKMYEYLWSENFFGCNEDGINTKNFLDRLNVYAKTKDSKNAPSVHFSDEEQKLVDRSFLTTSFEDVLSLCEEIKEFMKNQQQNEEPETTKEIRRDSDESEEQKESQVEESDADEEETDEESEESEKQESEVDEEESQDESEEQKESQVEESDADEEETDEEETDEVKPSGQLDGETIQEEFEPESETQDQLDNAFNEMVDKEKKSEDVAMVGSFPEDLIHKDGVIEFLEKKMKYTKGGITYGTGIHRRYVSNVVLLLDSDDRTAKFINDAKAQVALLCKQFDMKKRASLFSKSKIASTGELDVNLLSEYKFKDDLFLKDEILPKGKNHGLVLLIDFSYSMESRIDATCKQAAVLALFARKANIPLKIYGFTTARWRGFDAKKFDVSEQEINIGKAVIFQIIDTSIKVSKSDFVRVIKLLTHAPTWFYDISGMTPMSTTAMVVSDDVIRWKSKNQIERVSTLFLTDGASHYPVKKNIDPKIDKDFLVFYGKLFDTKTKKKHESSDMRSAYKIYKDRTQSSIGTMFIATRKDFRYIVNAKDFSELKAEGIVKVDYMSDVVDAYFYMTDEDRLSDVADMEIEEGKAAGRSFTKKARAKAKSIVFVTYFAELLG